MRNECVRTGASPFRRDVKPLAAKNYSKLNNSTENILQFWFRFVLPNLSYLETGRTTAVERCIRDHFIDDHVAYVYEDVCRERLWELADTGELGFIPERVGRWWSGSDEIDVVGMSAGRGAPSGASASSGRIPSVRMCCEL